MILYKGELYKTENQDMLLNELFDSLTTTLSESRLDTETVINAFDRLSVELSNGNLNSIIEHVDYEDKETAIAMATRMMSREQHEYKVKVEFNNRSLYEELPEFKVKTQRYPLGVIFHIAAGNMDVLPIISVAEGLLAGNINILKLPRVDQGLTIEVLKFLVDFEPKLKDYIYVFDTPSTDVAAMKKLADLCMERGIRDQIILIAGGTQVSPDMAAETGLDATFGRGTKGIDVVNAMVKNLKKRGLI